MGETLVEYSGLLVTDRRHFIARACGGPREDGKWQGWIEFIDAASGEVIRSRRETTQPDRDQTVYWATGLTPVYLEGALERALGPHPIRRLRRRGSTAGIPAGAGPAPEPPAPPPGSHPEAILNPYSVYGKGESLLRSQLAALSPWHLVNIIRAYDLSDVSSTHLSALPANVLVELIVEGVRQPVR